MLLLNILLFLLCLFFGLLFLVLFLACFSLKCHIVYLDGFETIVIHFLCFKFPIPLDEEEEESQIKTEVLRQSLKKAKDSSPSFSNNKKTSKRGKDRNTPKVSAEISSSLPKKQEQISMNQIITLVKGVSGAGKKILDKIYITQIKAEVCVSKGNPFDTAIAFGQVNGYLYGGLAFLNNILRMEYDKISIYPNFETCDSFVKCSFFVGIRPITILPILLKLGIKLFKSMIMKKEV